MFHIYFPFTYLVCNWSIHKNFSTRSQMFVCTSMTTPSLDVKKWHRYFKKIRKNVSARTNVFIMFTVLTTL